MVPTTRDGTDGQATSMAKRIARAAASSSSSGRARPAVGHRGLVTTR